MAAVCVGADGGVSFALPALYDKHDSIDLEMKMGINCKAAHARSSGGSILSKLSSGVVLGLSLMAMAGSAQALTFDFNFSGFLSGSFSGSGSVTGKVFGLGNNQANQAATGFEIDSFSDSSGFSSLPYSIPLANVTSNLFSVSGGNVTADSLSAVLTPLNGSLSLSTGGNNKCSQQTI